MKRLLLAIILFELPFQLDIYLFFQEEAAGKPHLDFFHGYLAKPPMAGAFWHHAMTEMYHVPIALAALARHNVPESGGK